MVKKASTPWTKNEDQLLKNLVDAFGLKKWKLINKIMIKHYGNWQRSPKQCRDRWVNGIDPNIINKKWTDEEEKILFEKHKIFGNKWCTITSFLYGRSGNATKNHFYSIIRKNIRKYNKKRVFGEKILEDIPELLKIPKFYSILVKPAKVRPKKIKVKKIVNLDGKKRRGRPKKEKKPKEKKTEVQIESRNLLSLPNIFQNNSATDSEYNLSFAAH